MGWTPTQEYARHNKKMFFRITLDFFFEISGKYTSFGHKQDCKEGNRTETKQVAFCQTNKLNSERDT